MERSELRYSTELHPWSRYYSGEIGQRVFDHTDETHLFLNSLQPGDVVNGFEKIEEINHWIDEAGRSFLTQLAELPSSDYVEKEVRDTSFNTTGFVHLKAVLRQGFWGRLEDPHLLIIDDSQANIRGSALPRTAQDIRRLTFFVVANLHSTGRGIFGETGVIGTVFAYRMRLRQASKSVSAKKILWRPLYPEQGADAIRKLNAMSRAQHVLPNSATLHKNKNGFFTT